MNLLLFDDLLFRNHLLPFTFTRPVAEIRVGILKIAEKWEQVLQRKPSFVAAEPYLTALFPAVTGTENLFINGAICPDDTLLHALDRLAFEEKLVQNDLLIAIKTRNPTFDNPLLKAIPFSGNLTVIRQLTDIFAKNGEQLRADFARLTAHRISGEITDRFSAVYHEKNIFIEEGVQLWNVTLNAETGPIYIGKNAVLQEGSHVRGSFAMGEGSHLNMGAKMRGDVTLGPFCKVGGEVSNSVFFGNANKAHEGYLGNSVIGEWCNLGADTNTSNMKNDYGTVKLWNYTENNFKDTGRQFCGTMLGDHTKTGINTMFNTGTVVGVSCNIFGGGFPPRYIPSFSWGGAGHLENYEIEKALQVARRMMERRNVQLSTQEEAILRQVHSIVQ